MPDLPPRTRDVPLAETVNSPFNSRTQFDAASSQSLADGPTTS